MLVRKTGGFVIT